MSSLNKLDATQLRCPLLVVRDFLVQDQVTLGFDFSQAGSYLCHTLVQLVGGSELTSYLLYHDSYRFLEVVDISSV